ncbi:MAG: 5'/3'-nucleotidase SurE [Acidobacteriota bacterium]|nr:5'/3'-nucleotidase SurE [Acidobacteriota bacterium]
MTRILVTNDDGIEAEGLAKLAEALTPLGEVTVVAPAEEKSAVGHGLTIRNPLQLQQKDDRWFSVSGTPTDCVNVAVSEVLGGVPDLVVAGINAGLNVGDDVTYSGTVAGALEGVLHGALGLAVSQQRETTLLDYAAAGGVAQRLAEAVLAQGLPRRTLLNVNVPRGKPLGVRVTVQARRSQWFSTTQIFDQRRETEVWVRSAELEWERDERSDYDAIQAGWVSVTPLHADWTNHAALAQVELAVASFAEVR